MSSGARSVLSIFVVTPPESVRRRFLDWQRPLLAQAIEHLAADWRGDGPLDLSRLWVVVSTRQAGRRLREGLAAHAARHGQAVFPPRVLQPESLVQLAAGGANDAATRLESLLAWARVLRELPMDAFRAVFPVDPPDRSFTWALGLGRELARLKRTLAEGGLRLQDVARRAGENFPEADRWLQLAELEARHRDVLAQLGRRDPQDVELENASAPPVPSGIERIVVLAAPDPMPLSLIVLDSLAAALPVDVVIFAPENAADDFDGWGRPKADRWARRELELPEFEQRVHLCADPAAQAERLVAIARNYRDPDAVLGLGVADPEVLGALENAFEQAQLAAFNPEGRHRKGDALHRLLSTLSAVARDGSFAQVEALARCPDFLACLESRFRNFSAARFLQDLDRMHAEHLPATLAQAREHATNRPLAAAALDLIDELRGRLQGDDFAAGAAAVLGTIFERRAFDLANPADERTAAAAEAWSTVLREIGAAAPLFPALGAAEWWEIALRWYADSMHYDDKPDGAVELQGWLELLWDDAPHLVVAGMNDGRVPDAIVGDPFLPEALRERLGLKTNADRFARDAYLLQALAAGRGAGRLDVFLGKTSAAGDPLRPSRLLLRCADEELPRRVRFLFRHVEGARAMPAWQRAWQLTPPRVSPPAKVAVTGLRAWLECPFRFYLQRVLRMESVDPAKNELDAFDFGTLCHAALEAMGNEAALRDCTDATTLRAFLLERVELEAARRYGAELTLPLLVQVESARQRLSRVADIQAQHRAEGWVIERVEQPFTLEIDGLTISGKIDRIDRHETSGAVLVLDYKTSDRPVDPFDAHVRGAKREETAPEFARFVYNGRECVWTDLQLPLYLRAIAGGAVTSDRPALLNGGYFNLPKASTETSLRPWEDYTRELEDAAWHCGEGVARAIRAGEFWPPNEKIRPERDTFGALFHRGVADSVAWSVELREEASR